MIVQIFQSCGNNTMPKDLELKKQKINKTQLALYKESENVKANDIQNLIDKFKILNQEIKDYTNQCNKIGIEKNNDETIIAINQKIEELENKKRSLPRLISYDEARMFIQNRCDEVGQTLMKSKTIYSNGIKLYLFLSVAENGYVCISTINENELDVAATDCGPSDEKIYQWNNTY